MEKWEQEWNAKKRLANVVITDWQSSKKRL